MTHILCLLQKIITNTNITDCYNRPQREGTNIDHVWPMVTPAQLKCYRLASSETCSRQRPRQQATSLQRVAQRWMLQACMGRSGSVGMVTRWTFWRSNPGGNEIFRSSPDRPWGPPNLPYNGYRDFPGGKETGAWCWPPTLYGAEVKERLELHSTPRLGLVACYRVLQGYITS